MKKTLPTLTLFCLRNSRLLVLTALLLLSIATQAAHFRSGTISWRHISGRTVEFKVSQSYGGWAFGGGYTLGSTQLMDYLYTGDGNYMPINLVITSINAAEGWWYGESTFQYTYPANGNYSAYFSSCCRISNLSNNADGSWYNETIVNVGTGNSSPVSTVAATVNLPTSLAAAQFQIPAFDPDGDVLSYRLSTPAEMGGGSNPSGVSINATTGVVTMNTVGRAIGSLWNVGFTISDGAGKTKVSVDFVVKITANSTPPYFDYLTTPANGSIFQSGPGQTISFPIKAQDNDPGSVVTLSAVGLPPGSTTTPSLPRSGNPVSTNFSWTPAPNQFGSYVLSFIATDNVGVQSTTSVTIQVSLKPTFNVPPTPAANSETYLETGEAHTSTISASDPDPNDVVRIVSVSGLPSGASLSSALPTATGNPVALQLNWTPTPANFGLHTVSFTAKDSYDDQAVHTFKYLVNTKPSFASTPSTTAYVGQVYTYQINGIDPDVAYGDVLKLIGGQIPAWLTFTNNGDGTGLLSGAPTMANLGLHQVQLKLEDTYHHDYSPIVSQQFTINVSGRMPEILGPGNQSASAATGTCGAIVNFAATETMGIPASTITYSHQPGSVFPVGVTTVTATATNIVGSSTTTFTVTVTDNENPTIGGLSAITVNADNGSCAATNVALGTPITGDNCGVASVTNNAPASFLVGNTTVTWTVTDVNGNSTTTTQVVTVKDNQAPTVRVNNVTVTLVNGSASVNAVQINNGSSDNCGVQSVVLSGKVNYSCADIGQHTVTLTVTDIHGNTASANAVVTVAGVIPSASITAVPSNNTYTGGVPTNLYLGYGPQSLTLQVNATGGAPYSYSWTGNGTLSSTTAANPVFTATVAGNYTFVVTVTNVNGCTTTATVSVCVRDIRVPGTNGNNAKVYLCHVPPGNAGNPQTLSISVNAVASHLTQHSGDRLGTCGMLPCGVASSIAGGEIEAAKVEIEDHANELNVIASPNPTMNYFELLIQSADKTTPVQVRVTSMSGRVLTAMKATVGQKVRFGQEYTSGTYIAEAIQGNKRKTVKLIKGK